LQGVFVQNLTTVSGCDSVVTTTVTLVPSISTQLAATTCDPALQGVFVQNLTAVFGCDSIVTTTVTLVPSFSTQLAATTCDPALQGVFVQNLTAVSGCDSIVTTTVTLVPSISTQLAATTCDPALQGVFVQNLTAVFGCDSTVTTTVTLLPSTSTQLAATTCDPTLQGVFVQNLTAVNGCDSIVTTTVSYIAVDTTFLMLAGVCDTTLAGNSLVVLSNQFGCDSVIQIRTPLLSNPSISVDISDYAGYALSCADSEDGVISISISGNEPVSYAWSNGATTAMLTDLSAGLYTVTVTSIGNCTSTENVLLSEPPALVNDLEITALNCEAMNAGGVLVNTTGGVPPLQYSLNGMDFQLQNTFQGLAGGSYQVVVKDVNGCLFSDNFVLSAPIELVVDLGEDKSVWFGDSLLLQATVNAPSAALQEVVWSPPILPNTCINCLSQKIFPTETSTYWVEVISNDGCRAFDDVVIRVDKRRDVYVPNIFSPNDDGNNDILSIYARPGAIRTVKRFQIFDRWGDQVYQALHYQPNQDNIGWDGNFNGKALDPAVFVWVAEVEFLDGTNEIFKGDVTLFR
jgi:gliding motility-associated-like protein